MEGTAAKGATGGLKGIVPTKLESNLETNNLR